MGARRPQERNMKLAGRWTTQARTGVCRSCGFSATVRSRRRRWNRKRSAKPLAGVGTLSRSSLRIGRRTATGTASGRCNNYSDLQEFEELFRGQFRDFLEGQIDQETGQKLLSRKVRRWKSSPFRGLNVFDFEHAPIFHGRTRAIGGVLEALEAASQSATAFCAGRGCERLRKKLADAGGRASTLNATRND